jgi:hypothetical protein
MFCFKPLEVHVTFLKRNTSTPASILGRFGVPMKLLDFTVLWLASIQLKQRGAPVRASCD